MHKQIQDCAQVLFFFEKPEHGFTREFLLLLFYSSGAVALGIIIKFIWTQRQFAEIYSIVLFTPPVQNIKHSLVKEVRVLCKRVLFFIFFYVLFCIYARFSVLFLPLRPKKHSCCFRSLSAFVFIGDAVEFAAAAAAFSVVFI